MLRAIETFWDVVRLLGGVAVVSTAIVGASVWLTKKWIERGFSKELETHKADLQRANAAEVERLKLELSTDLGRRTRLLEREFVALPELWDKVHDAIAATYAVSARYRPGTNVYGLTLNDLNRVLEHLEVPDYVKDEVRQIENMHVRQARFTELENEVKLNLAHRTVNQARNYLLGHGIFLDQATSQAIRDLLELARAAVDQAVHNHRFPPQPGGRVDLVPCDAFIAGAAELLRTAEALVRERLGATAPAVSIQQD